MADLLLRLTSMYSHRGDGLPTQYVNPDGLEAAALITEMAAALERIRRGKRVNWDGANFCYEALDGDAAREIARAAIAKLGGERG